MIRQNAKHMREMIFVIFRDHKGNLEGQWLSQKGVGREESAFPRDFHFVRTLGIFGRIEEQGLWDKKRGKLADFERIAFDSSPSFKLFIFELI